MPPQPKPYTVTALTRVIKGTLEESFPGVWVEGEISGYHFHPSSGHRYFNLKDESATIKVTLWRSLGQQLRFEPEDGQRVVVLGDVTVYERQGTYQLNARKLTPVGTGDLELAFRQLFEKLSKEGLFDPSRKRPLPEFPIRIGIVTSASGAALRDIINIARRRNPAVELVIYPAAVQGHGAENEIAAGIDYFNRAGSVDVVIAGRGGGSLEDLWAFNTETVVRAIVRSDIPVVSAVGHEVDTTLSDLAADLRAPTPSAAAELVVWSRAEYLARVSDNVRQQAGILRGEIDAAREALMAFLTRPVFRRPQEMLRQRQQYLDFLGQALNRNGKNSLERYGGRLSLSLTRLDSLSPLKVLARGYSVTRREDQPEKLVRSIAGLAAGDRLETVLSDGQVISQVESIRSGKITS